MASMDSTWVSLTAATQAQFRYLTRPAGSSLARTEKTISGRKMWISVSGLIPPRS